MERRRAPAAIFPEGLRAGGLVATARSALSALLKLETAFPLSANPRPTELAEFYALEAARIDALLERRRRKRKTAAFETRQVWLDSLLTDRRKVQEIMDYQARAIAHLELIHEELRGHMENLRRDRAKAQLIMDSQHEQLKRWVTEKDALRAKVESLKAQLNEHKAILKAARKACRKKGRCFQIERRKTKSAASIALSVA